MLKGTKHSEETKAKLSAARMGREVSPETRAKIGAANRAAIRKHVAENDDSCDCFAHIGHTVSIETRAKISAALLGRKLSTEHRAKLSAANIGNVVSHKTRAKISANRMGHSVSPETRAKIGAANAISLRGQKLSPETRAKMGASRMGHTVTPETRAKMSIARKNHMIEPRGDVCACGVCTPAQSPTHIEEILANVLLAEFPEVRREEKFGRYWVDAYLPSPYHLAFEADGAYWHKSSSKRDGERDLYLLQEFGLPIVRLSERELLTMEVQ